MTDLIRFEEVQKTYQMGEVEVEALRNVDLTVEKGEFLILMGPSGSGKSTSLNLMGGLDRPTSGRIIVNGEDISTYGNQRLTQYRRQEVGIIFQMYNLIPTLTAAENVELALSLIRHNRNLRKLSYELLERVGLGDRADHFPAQLSGGQQQRVAIARALANAPRLLLCDEPTGNLDEETGEMVLDVIKLLNKEDGTTVVMVTHDMLLKTYGDRIVYLRSGQVDRIEEVAPDQHKTPALEGAS